MRLWFAWRGKVSRQQGGHSRLGSISGVVGDVKVSWGSFVRPVLNTGFPAPGVRRDIRRNDTMQFRRQELASGLWL